MKIKTHYEELRIPENNFFSVRYVERDNKEPWHIANHYSNSLEIIVYKHIDGTLYLEDSCIPLETQSVLALPPYTLHAFDVKKGQHDYYIIHLLYDNAPSIIRDLTLPTKVMLFNISPRDASFINELLSYIANQPLTSISQQVITLFITWFSKQTSTQTLLQANSTALNKDRFITLFKYLDEHMIYRLSVDDAAAICHISKSHFFALFKAHFGKTFSDFMIERQINQAKYLLSTTDLSITQLALSLSFCDASYFSRIFKSSVGMTPLAFRKQHS